MIEPIKLAVRPRDEPVEAHPEKRRAMHQLDSVESGQNVQAEHEQRAEDDARNAQHDCERRVDREAALGVEKASTSNGGQERVGDDQAQYPSPEEHEPVTGSDSGGRSDEDRDLGRAFDSDAVKHPDSRCRARPVTGVGLFGQSEVVAMRVSVVVGVELASEPTEPSRRHRLWNGLEHTDVGVIVRPSVSVCVVDMGVRVLVFDGDMATEQTLPNSTEPRERAADDEHPARLQPEVTTLASELDEDPNTERQQGDADDPARPLIE